MCHWFSPDTPNRVSSFGGLQHFRKSGKPAEAGDATRCLDCAYETQCPYSAKKSEFFFCSPIYPLAGPPHHRGTEHSSVYLDRVATGRIGWPVRPLVDGIPDIENVTDALAHGPYGKCVYENDNDVCDNQVRTTTGSPTATVPYYNYTLTAPADYRNKKGRQHPICNGRDRLFHDGRLHLVGMRATDPPAFYYGRDCR